MALPALYHDQRFSEMLIADGVISRERLTQLLGGRERTTEPLLDMLVRHGLLSEYDRVRYLGRQLGIPSIRLNDLEISTEAIRMITGATAYRINGIPVEKSATAMSVALANPMDIDVIDELQRITGLVIDVYIAAADEIQEAIRRHYGAFDTLSEIVRTAADAASQEDVSSDEEALKSLSISELAHMEGRSPIIRLVYELIMKAVNMRASDIHINPEKDRVRIRYRVDGMLQSVVDLPRELQAAVVSRIKIMSQMDIAERRAPQDGRISLMTAYGEFDFRVSTYPALHGENVVIRILDKTTGKIGLDKIGMSQELQESMRSLVTRPYGMILVCGPTGSGKTTTLYGALNALNSADRNIMTIEDPVEYQLPGIIQGNVNARAGVTFATGLRSLVRQDPDVILVGEIRDQDTARIAIEASLTGHLVLSTIHANDSAGAVTRLIDMGIEPFLVASSLLGALTQRLLRVNCTRCSTAYLPPEGIMNALNLDRLPAGATLRKGVGCELCNQHGFKGRTGVYELMEMSSIVQELILNKVSSQELRSRAVAQGGTLRDDALRLAYAGKTTPEEVLRVTVL